MLTRLMSLSVCAGLVIVLGTANAASTEKVDNKKIEILELSDEQMDTVSAGFHYQQHTATANANANARGYRTRTNAYAYTSTGYNYSSSAAGSSSSSN